jgi:hypothetical protein
MMFLDLDSVKGQLMNLVPMDLVLDYMILPIRIYLYLIRLRSSRVQLFVETNEVARADLRVMIRLMW